MMTERARQWGGDAARAAVAACLATHGDRCWLCGHPGATSLDHVIPASTRPDLEWEPANHRPAHLTRPGTPTGCTVTGCTCPGNKGRKATPHTAPPTRAW